MDVIHNTVPSMFPETGPKSVDVARHNIMHRNVAASLGSISLLWTSDNWNMTPCSYAGFMALGYTRCRVS